MYTATRHILYEAVSRYFRISTVPVSVQFQMAAAIQNSKVPEDTTRHSHRSKVVQQLLALAAFIPS
jgi:hypothetical protein